MLKKIESLFDDLFSAQKTIPAGVYPYQSSESAVIPYKLHLRIDEDGSGILIINASTVLHLNQTAAEYTWHLIQGRDEKETASLVAERYAVDEARALGDLREFLDKIDALVQSQDLDPVTYLDVDRVAPYSKLTAPYRLDCALTYRVREGVRLEVAPTERVSRELSTEEWKILLKKAWGVGIPHVILTGGEPTLRDDLPDLVAEAEKLGIVCGLLTDGLALTNKQYMNELLGKGLDHIMVIANDKNKDFWKALGNLIEADIAVEVHTTLTAENRKGFNKILEKLAKAGVARVSMSTESKALSEALKAASQKASALGMTQVWDLPVPYSAAHPVAIELAESESPAPEGAGSAWLYVEPDGDVLPAQGVNRVLGNLLKDPWSRIWKRR